MTLWLLLAVMTAAAAFAVLWPLRRDRKSTPGGDETAVYRDQLMEVERDRAAGAIAAKEAEAARIELSRRLLAAADRARAADVADAGMARWRRRIVALVALVLFPGGAILAYLALGSPMLPSQPLAARLERSAQQPSIASLVAQVEAHLEQKPTDGQGWEVVAPVYMRIGRFDDAAKARANALRLLGPSAEREAALGEALVMQANGMVTADAKAAFARALAREPGEPRATYYLGIAAEQDGRNAEAARLWSEMLARGPADAPWVAVVRAALARVATAPAATATAPSAADPPATAPSAPGPSAPGPSAQDVATAAQMAPEDRNAMIAGMVTRLAERLGREGGDVEGWIRLLRAYMVLGDREKLRAAITDARRALAAMPDKLRQLDAAIKDIGLDG